MTATSAPPPEVMRAHRRRAIVASTVGTTIEWYDFFLYGTSAALIFPKLFFPSADPSAGILLAFGTQFVGFAARPIGAAIFGHYGDRIGRKATLVSTLLIMGISTALIGLLPAYAGDRDRRAAAADAAAADPGRGRRRRVGRVGAHRDGVGRRRNGAGSRASWPQLGVPLGLLLSTGMVQVFSAHHRARIRDVGLARAVPAEHRAGGGRAVRAAEGAGEPGVQRGAQDAGRGEDAGDRGVPHAVAGDPRVGVRADVGAGAVLPVHHVRADLRHRCT